MADLFQPIGEKLKDFGGNWASYSVAGSFALYVLGYLALRFHLTALGVGTDLNVLDERYLFAGAKCLVYLVSAAASAVFLGLLLAAPVYGVYLLLAVGTGGRSSAWIARAGHRATTPTRLTLTGLLFSAALIQLVMNECFAFGNLLLRDRLPPDSALSDWLCEDDLALYFYGMVGAAMVSGVMLLATSGDGQENPAQAWIWRLFAFLVAVQWLLLPVNYGYLVMDKQMAEVASLDGATPLPPEREAWLAWESKDYLTFLVLDRKEKPVRRSLLTVPHEKVKTIEIIAYDPIFRALCVGTARADWLDKVAYWLNLTRTPGEMKAPSDAPQAGDIFIATLDGKAPQALTVGGGFRSPVFLPDGKTLLALRGDDLVSVSASGGLAKALYAVADAVKLLGVNREIDSKLLLSKKADGGTELGELELGSGQVKRLPNDPDNPAHERMLSQLRGDDREYEGISIHLRTESKARLGGKTVWTDIYIKQGSQSPSNVSRCGGANCSQPSLSFDGLRVVFIKANNAY